MSEAAVVMNVLVLLAGLEHSLVLGIDRDKEWLPLPRLAKKSMEDDFHVIYGKLGELTEQFG